MLLLWMSVVICEIRILQELNLRPEFKQLLLFIVNKM